MSSLIVIMTNILYISHKISSICYSTVNPDKLEKEVVLTMKHRIKPSIDWKKGKYFYVKFFNYIKNEINYFLLLCYRLKKLFYYFIETVS